MLYGISEELLVALVGLGGGVMLGLAARIGRFCSLGAIEDALYAGSRKRIAMWGIAIGVAMIGVFLCQASGRLDFSEALYHREPFSPILAILGGLIFGYGMSIAGNCGFGALARLGGGDLRSFVIVIVVGISSFITISGPLAPLRVWILERTSIDLPAHGYAGLLSQLGVPMLATGVVVGLAFIAAGLRQPDLRRDYSGLFWSAVVGSAIVTGWVGTQWVASEGFAVVPVMSHTYSAPIGESIFYIMTSSAGGLSFGVGSVAGVLLGAFLGSLFKGHFRWEACEDPRELRRQILGAAMMGVGAVFALGCTVGQGLSALSVLAYSTPFTIAAILVGATLGLRHLISGSILIR